MVGAGVALAAQGAELDGARGGATGADGSFTARYRLGAAVPGQLTQFEAHAIVPDPVPATFASSTVRAQRVVRGAWLGLEALVTPTPAATTTSLDHQHLDHRHDLDVHQLDPAVHDPARLHDLDHQPTSTTTTHHDSTDHPDESATSDLQHGRDRVRPAPPRGPPTTAIESLPRTGGHTAGWALIGAGLVLLGATLVAVSRGWAR